jgi:hypothetical protein
VEAAAGRPAVSGEKQQEELSLRRVTVDAVVVDVDVDVAVEFVVLSLELPSSLLLKFINASSTRFFHRTGGADIVFFGVLVFC